MNIGQKINLIRIFSQALYSVQIKTEQVPVSLNLVVIPWHRRFFQLSNFLSAGPVKEGRNKIKWIPRQVKLCCFLAIFENFFAIKYFQRAKIIEIIANKLYDVQIITHY